jgi:putative ABC transport system substrate-binding protein
MNGSAALARDQALLATFTQTLQKLGWRERDNVQFDVRWSEGNVERMRAYAVELVGLAPDIILASSTANLAAVLRATRSVPVMFIQVSDPVAQGFVASLAARRHITGFCRLRVLDRRQMGRPPQEDDAGPCARRGHVQPTPLHSRAVSARGPLPRRWAWRWSAAPVRNPRDRARHRELSPARAAILTTDTFTIVHRKRSSSHSSATSRADHVAACASFVLNGIDDLYVDFEPQFRQAAFYVDRFFKGTKLAELPVQLPTKFTLIVNLKTAAALGIEVPLPILMSVDEVIE